MVAILVSFLTFLSNIGAQGEVAWDQEAYAKEVNGRFPILNKLTLGQFPPPRYEITWDPVFQEAWATVEAANGFDMIGAGNLMPDVFYYSRWQTQMLPWLYNGLGDRWLDKAMDYHEQDKTVLKTVYRLAGALIKMPEALDFEAVPLETDPNDYEFVGHFSYADGSTVAVKTGTTYNTDTGRIGTDKGFGNLGYNYYVKDNLLATTDDSWQRRLGYMKLYDDILLKTTKMVNVDTIRLKFRYDGRDWMVQLWKGRYFNMPGGEVGVYYKPKSRLIEFYDACGDEDRIGISFKISDKSNGAVLIDKPLRLHWWQTGFAAYEKPLTSEKLILETILVPKDEAMMAALKAALDKEGVLQYTALETELGPAVHVVW